MTLIVTHGAKEEFASEALHALSCLQAEPQPFCTTARAILRGAMWIDFHADNALRVRFFFRELIDFAFQLIRLFAIEPP